MTHSSPAQAICPLSRHVLSCYSLGPYSLNIAHACTLVGFVQSLPTRTCSRMGLPMPTRPPSASAAPRVHPSRPLPTLIFSSDSASPSCSRLMMYGTLHADTAY